MIPVLFAILLGPLQMPRSYGQSPEGFAVYPARLVLFEAFMRPA